MAFTHDDISRLSPQERIALIDELRVSLDATAWPLTPAQAAELDRRIATFDEELPHSVSWDALKAELAAKAP